MLASPVHSSPAALPPQAPQPYYGSYSSATDCSTCATFLAVFKVSGGSGSVAAPLPGGMCGPAGAHACCSPAHALPRPQPPQDLAFIGAVPATAQGMSDWCYNTAQYGGGLSLEG